MDYKKIEKENILLKKKLEVARLWMEKEVKNQIKIISKNKISNSVWEEKNTFFSENIDEIVKGSVAWFFWELILLNTPDFVVENMVSAELQFYHLRQNKSLDGLWVITSYQKSLDYIIENYITKWFRKFANKSWQNYLRKNDPLEKTLNMVVNKGYILWVSRLYHLLSLLKFDKEYYDYVSCFRDYLDKNTYIKEVLLSDDFFYLLWDLVKLEVFWRKRHIGKITYDETKKSREILVWWLKNHKSIIFMLIEMNQVDI